VSSAIPDPSHSLLVEHVRASLAIAIRAGYVSFDAAIEAGIEHMIEEVEEGHAVDADAVASDVRALAFSEVETLRAAQATWIETTDNDRLERAFKALEDAGIVARENFTCCQTCGHAEIGDEIDAWRDAGRSVRGYVFFHQQDTERATEGQGLMLAYGVASEGVEAIEIGSEIVRALDGAGLAVRWDGAEGSPRIIRSYGRNPQHEPPRTRELRTT
jgi:hypothetical protein